MILTVGEAVMDFLPERNLDGARTFRPVLGGSAFNVALGLGRLGIPAGYMWSLSTDLFGARFVAALEEADVDVGRVVFAPQPTTLAFIDVKGSTPEYAIFDNGSAGRLFEPGDASVLDEETVLVHTGSFVLGTEPIGTRLEEFAEAEVENRLFSLDLNVRANLVEDEETYRQRLARMIELADIVKASAEDIMWLYPGQPPEMVMEHWLETGTTIAIVTRDADGVNVATDQYVLSKPAHQVAVVDTVGAGDGFMAGFLGGLESTGVLTTKGFKGLTEERLEHATILGQRCAAFVCAHAGTEMPWRYEISGD